MACRRSLLGANRKLLSLYNRWDVYRGDQPKPALNVLLASAKKDRKLDFKINGNNVERSTGLQGSQVIAEQLRRSVRKGGSRALFEPHYEVYASQAFRFFSMASPEVTGKDGNPEACMEETVAASGEEKVEPVIEQKDESTQNVGKKDTPEVEPSPSRKDDSQINLEDKELLLTLLGERDTLLEEKGKQLADLKERALRSMAELDNVRERVRREADNTKKYAIQDFAKSLLDVADNLGRAITTVPDQIQKEALANDESDTAKFLKSLLEGVMMTEKELMKIFKRFGIEKCEPVGQPFDPNSHLALFELNVPNKEAGTVAMVVKAGYKLHDRVLRPADVGVVKAMES